MSSAGPVQFRDGRGAGAGAAAGRAAPGGGTVGGGGIGLGRRRDRGAVGRGARLDEGRVVGRDRWCGPVLEGGQQLAAQLGGGRRPPVGLAGEGVEGHRLQGHRQLGSDGAGRGRVLVEAGEDGGRVGVTGERHPAAHHLVEDDAQRVEVGAGIDGVALHLLGGEVLGGAQHRALGRVVGVGDLGDAEVGDHHPVVVGEEDVGRLDVPVDEPGPVRGLQRLGDSGGDLHGLGRSEATFVVEVAAQRDPPHQLHDDGLVAVAAVRVVDGDDRRVGQAGGGDGLAAEALDEVLVAGQVGVEDLDGHRPVEDLVVGLPDLGHPTDGQSALEAVATGEQRAGPVGPLRGRGGRRFGHGDATLPGVTRAGWGRPPGPDLR